MIGCYRLLQAVASFNKIIGKKKKGYRDFGIPVATNVATRYTGQVCGRQDREQNNPTLFLNKNPSFHCLSGEPVFNENLNSYPIARLDALTAEETCRSITATLPEWFGIPEANDRYAIGVRERTSFGIAFDGHYVGMITIEFPFSNNANIYWMGIVKKYHGQGIGLTLLRHVEKFCREQHCQSLTVETLSSRENDANYLMTYQFYIKAGFQPLFELHTYGPDYLMVYLQKTIL